MNAWAALFDDLREQAIRAGNDPRRVERGLELVASGRLQERIAMYGTTARTCGCADRQKNWRKTRRCKHILGMAMRQRIAQHMGVR